MATMPLEFQTSAYGAPDRHPTELDGASKPGEYTRLHRETWPLLLRKDGSQALKPDNLRSWMRLWGRLGAELYCCFWSGDEFVQTDMIARARTLGGWRGRILADQLSGLIPKSITPRFRIKTQASIGLRRTPISIGVCDRCVLD